MTMSVRRLKQEIEELHSALKEKEKHIRLLEKKLSKTEKRTIHLGIDAAVQVPEVLDSLDETFHGPSAAGSLWITPKPQSQVATRLEERFLEADETPQRDVHAEIETLAEALSITKKKLVVAEERAQKAEARMLHSERNLSKARTAAAEVVVLQSSLFERERQLAKSREEIDELHHELQKLRMYMKQREDLNLQECERQAHRHAEQLDALSELVASTDADVQMIRKQNHELTTELNQIKSTLQRRTFTIDEIQAEVITLVETTISFDSHCTDKLKTAQEMRMRHLQENDELHRSYQQTNQKLNEVLSGLMYEYEKVKFERERMQIEHVQIDKRRDRCLWKLAVWRRMELNFVVFTFSTSLTR
eukprot:753895-Hanusia_phi.AAC.4